MNYFVEFYKNLDTFNLVMFWSVVVIIILLLVFAIIITNKNRKLKKILINKENEANIHEKNTSEYRDIPTSDEKLLINNHSELPETKTPVVEKEPEIIKGTPKEEKFIPEEHVIAYDKKLFTLPNIEKVTDIKEEKEEPIVKEQTTGPYQRNVLRNTYANQTSPIGISKANSEEPDELKKATELSNALEAETVNVYSHNESNNTYLNEVSQKLTEAKNNEGISRTAYELAEEENAIISYKELMQKKDQIKTIDEEESVISIQELLNKKAKEKVYNITNNEADEEFINELKNFRHDL